MAISPDGLRVYVTGCFSSTDAGIGGTGSIGSSGGEDAFVLALDANTGLGVGGFGSGGVQKFGGTSLDFGQSVAVSPDGSTVYVTGDFRSNNAGIGGFGSIASSGGYDAFVLALNAADGSAVSSFGSGGVQKFGGTLDDYGYGVAVSPNGSRVYVTGYFASSNAGLGGTGSFASSGGQDVFVLALRASDGSAISGFGNGGVQKFGGTGDDMARGVAVSPDGLRVYVTGDFSSTDAGIGGTGSVASSGNWDAFVLALNAADGSAINGLGSGGVQKFGGTGGDFGKGVAVSPDGSRVYVAGEFYSTDARVGDAGPTYNATGFGGFLLGLDAPPSINTIRPACGGTGGGTSVTITGSAFTGGATVTFGGTAAKVLAVNSTTITCFAPGHAAGAVDVVVTTPGGSATSSGGFTYVADAVANVYPPVIQGHAQALAVDASGNRYVAGYFSGAVDFNPGVGVDAKASAGIVNAFVTRFNADGTYAWTQTFGGSAYDYACGVAISPDGARVYVTGYFSSTDAGVGGTGSVACLGWNAAFVLALSASDGSAISRFGSGGVQKFGGRSDDEGFGVAVSPDGSRVYVTGYFSSNDAGIGGLGSIFSLGLADAFVLALDTTTGVGVPGFGSGGVQTFGGTGDDLGQGVAVSPDGSRVYVTGSFSSNNAGIGVTGSVHSSGGYDTFVLALDTTTGLGVPGFGSGGIQQFGGTGDDEGEGVAVSPDGARVYVTGYFNSNNAGIGGTLSIGSSGGADAFVLALSADDGSAISGFGSGGVQKFGGTDNDAGHGVAVSPDGLRVYVTGYFESNNAGIGGTVSIASSGWNDAFVLALNAPDGSAISGFGSGGVQKFGGTGNDVGYGVAVSPDGARVYLTGYFLSTNARVGSAGPTYVATGFLGFLLTLDAATGSPPAIQLTSREAEDTDGNGHIDAIRIVTNAPLNDNFAGLQITVAGYTVTGYDTGATANDNEFFVRLSEGTTPDTDATPGVQVVAGGSLGLAVDAAPVTPGDKAKPVLMSASWYDGSGAGVDAGDPIYLTFSEPVTSKNALVTDFGLPVKNDTLGAGATVSIGQNTTDPKILTITLQGDPLLTPGGVYSPVLLTAGSPTGVYVADGTRIVDAAGNSALVQSVGTAVDLQPSTEHVSICWDDLSVAPRDWNIGDSTYGATYQAFSYFPPNGLVARNNGNVREKFTATLSGYPSGWMPAPVAGPDQFELKINNGAPPWLDLSTGPKDFGTQLYSGHNQPFDLLFGAPASVTSGANVGQIICVIITATKD